MWKAWKGLPTSCAWCLRAASRSLALALLARTGDGEAELTFTAAVAPDASEGDVNIVSESGDESRRRRTASRSATTRWKQRSTKVFNRATCRPHCLSI